MRVDHRPWAMWLLALLLAPTVLALAGRHPNDTYAGRQRPPGPGFEVSRLLDEDYYHEVDSWAEEHLSMRGAGLWARAMVDYEIFGETGNDRVTAGSDGWLYLTPYLTVPCEELAEISIPTTPDIGRKRLRVVIAAPKAAFHPEPLGSIRPCETEARSAWRATVEDDNNYLDVNRSLDRLRERDPEVALFYERDTHWSPPARRSVARTIVNGLQTDLWDRSALIKVDGDPFEEELLRSIGLVGSVTLPDWEVQRSVEPVVVTDLPFGGTGLRGVYETTMAGDDPVVSGTTLVIGDSQMDFLLPYIAPYFERMVFVQLGLIELGYDVTRHPADRVLFESVEFSASARLTPEFMETLAAVTEDGDA